MKTNTLPKAVIESANHIDAVEGAISGKKREIAKMNKQIANPAYAEFKEELQHDLKMAGNDLQVLENALVLLKEEHRALVNEQC